MTPLLPALDSHPVDMVRSGTDVGYVVLLMRLTPRCRETGYRELNARQLVDFKNLNFAKKVEAMGILRIRVEGPADLDQAISRPLTRRGPALLGLMTRPQEMGMPPKIHLGRVYGVSPCMLKGCNWRARRGAHRAGRD
jgi:hypothetical protein